MKKKLIKWSVLSLLMIYIVGALVWSHAEAARHTLSDIDVEISGKGQLGTITPDNVKGVLEKYPEPIIGAKVHTVNTLDVADYLRKFNNFESVECVITSHGKLLVKVVPVIPELRVFDGDKSYYINKDGKIIDSNARFFVDVPVVSGEFDKKFTPSHLLPVVRFINSDKTLSQLVGMIYAQDKDNILLVPRIRGHVINLGDTTRLAEKRDAILTAYHKILPNKGWETYDTISVKFKGQIVATRRNKAPLHPEIVIEEEGDPEETALAGLNTQEDTLEE